MLLVVLDWVGWFGGLLVVECEWAFCVSVFTSVIGRLKVLALAPIFALGANRWLLVSI